MQLGNCLSCPGETEQPFTSSYSNRGSGAICDISGGNFSPIDGACQGSESVNDQDQVMVGDRTCQVKLSAINSWPTQTTAKHNSMQELIHSTQVQLDAEASSSNMTDTCTVQGQTSQLCALLSASLSDARQGLRLGTTESLSDGLLHAQQHEDNGAAALPPEQCMANLVHIGKAPLQCQCSQTQGSTDSVAMSQLNAGTADLASVSAAMSMVGRMMSAATGCFCA